MVFEAANCAAPELISILGISIRKESLISVFKLIVRFHEWQTNTAKFNFSPNWENLKQLFLRKRHYGCISHFFRGAERRFLKTN